MKNFFCAFFTRWEEWINPKVPLSKKFFCDLKICSFTARYETIKIKNSKKFVV
ncbi:hypothetical protein B4099_0038 [Heyndrickxia coagulans]|uniref:Uncharacterized protein n=1 Tax=Heyndrickxia coagulans TaxID=1398 RepID=A0A150KB07_HEYCO|nr:hypothetical protein B4099_0038 [Heyndrickxia coagulans]